MNRFFQRSVFVVSLAVLAALLVGEVGLRAVRAGSEQDGAYRPMNVYRQVLSKVQTDYVTEPNMSDVTTGALHGLLESLDSDSSYLTPGEYKIYKQRPASGIAQVGISISKRFGYAVVVSVLPGSPADKEHLTDGDVIEAIGDQSTHDLSPAVIKMLLEGKPGSAVTLSVVRPRKPDPDKLTLTRAVTPIPALGEEQYDNATILYLKPVALTAQRVDEMEARLKAWEKPEPRKVLLDLRNVSDGDVTQALRLANFFVKQGTLATLAGQKYPQQTFTADSAAFLTAAPLSVLINRGTAGPAELVVGALEDDKRADVVGERTFGEGSLQKTIELPDGAALLLTIAKYRTPSGKKIQDEALAPTVEVNTPIGEDGDGEAAPAKGDETLDKALDLLKQKKA